VSKHVDLQYWYALQYAANQSMQPQKELEQPWTSIEEIKRGICRPSLLVHLTRCSWLSRASTIISADFELSHSAENKRVILVRVRDISRMNACIAELLNCCMTRRKERVKLPKSSARARRQIAEACRLVPIDRFITTT